MYGNSSRLCCFGGSELCINDNCNVNENSNSNIGDTYKPPEGMVYNSEEAKKYLAGSHKFRVEEIEVYKIVKKWIGWMIVNKLSWMRGIYD